MENDERDNLMKLQMLDQQIRQLDEQITLLQAQVEQTQIILNALDELKDQKEGSEIFAPIANGVFVKAKIMDVNKLTINIGADTMVEKSIEDTKKLVEAQLSEMGNARDNLIMQIQQLIKEAKHAQQEVQKPKKKGGAKSSNS